MEEVYRTPNGKKLFVGNDHNYPGADKRDWWIVSACKDGPWGHRAELGYTSMAAPKDKDYYFVQRGHHLALNLIDTENPDFIPDEVINAALKFIDAHLKDSNVLVHCNHGRSRSPSIAMLYLRSIGELPDRFSTGMRMFHSFYPKFDPNKGMGAYLRKRYVSFGTKTTIT